MRERYYDLRRRPGRRRDDVNIAHAALLASFTGAFAIVESVPIPFSPGPFTLQVLGVFLGGLLLGPVWGAASMLLYLVAGAVGAPWFVAADAVPPALASYRILLVLFVSTSYVRTTPVRDSRAAIQRTVPGQFGRFLGVGVALVFRVLPVLQRDIARIRNAQRGRLGARRSVRDRA